MDNNKLDDILKEKLKNQIKPSKELENEIKQKIAEEKMKHIKVEKTKKVKKYTKMKKFISVAAVLVIICTFGIYFKEDITDIVQPSTNNVSVVKIKTITPTKSENGILASDSEFIIYAEGENIDKESIQKSIYVEPALDYTIEKINNNEYKLKFEQNIPDNTIVKLQYVKNKITEDSWAYQTSNKLSISSTYPDNNSKYVSQNTSIEIKFSYANIENLENYIEMSPKINGTWEHLGKIWKFTPQEKLKKGQKYVVKINEGITVDGESLDEYTFNFTIQGEDETKSYIYNTISMDGINTYKSDEAIRMYCKKNAGYKGESIISKIEISKFNSVEDFIEYLKTENYDKANNIGNYKFTQTENYIQLSKTLQEGYYVASVISTGNNEIFNCPIQINNLSAYALETEKDIITWVGEENDLAQNISVEYQGEKIKTDKDGIAKFENIVDNSKTIQYLKIGNNENKLVIGIYNYEQSNYPYSYIYTDRLLYKNIDTINIWGFVPKELFYNDLEDEFYIKFSNSEKQKIKINEDGTFTYKIDIENYSDTYGYIWLYYKDSILASREIEIQNYNLQNYTYEILLDNNYVFTQSKLEFGVKVEHITGINVPNKSVIVKFDGEMYKKVTQEDGIAYFSIDVKEIDSYESEPTYKEISVYNGDAEEYNISVEYRGIYLINRNAYTKIEKNDKNLYNITLYKLANKDTDVSYYLSEIYDGTYDTTVDINLIETTNERYISSYRYNEYTKENVPEYSYKISENTEKIKTITTQNGNFTINTNELKIKKSTEEKYYNYLLEIVYKDMNGKVIKNKVYVYIEENDNFSLGYYYDGFFENSASDDGLSRISSDISNRYYLYRYLLQADIEKFSIGDTVKFNLAESTENGIKNIKNKGKLLRIVLQENINNIDIIKNDEINYTFTDEDFPGCKITSVYFLDGKFYRMPIYYFDFKEEDRKVDIEIIADKEEYKPGDKVNLKIKTTNNGKPIKSTVNISVANEAIFELEDDYTPILENIYGNKELYVYTYSSYRDFIASDDLGGGGGGRRFS